MRFLIWLRTPMTVCAWCPPGAPTVIRYGNPFVPKSHGMCAPCAYAWSEASAREVAVFRAVLSDPRRI